MFKESLLSILPELKYFNITCEPEKVYPKIPKCEETRNGIYAKKKEFLFSRFNDAGFIRSPVLPTIDAEVVEYARLSGSTGTFINENPRSPV